MVVQVSTGAVYMHPDVIQSRKSSFCPKPGEFVYTHPIPVLREMDVITRDLAREYGADVLDQNKLRELSPYDGDGMHCGMGIVCQGMLDALVRLIELGPQH